MTAAPDIDVVVVAYRSADDLRDCVSPLVSMLPVNPGAKFAR